MNVPNYVILDFSFSAEELLDLFKTERNLFFLHSSQIVEHRGRYSFLGFDPFEIFISTDTNTLGELKKRFYEYKKLLPKEYFTFLKTKNPLPPFFSGLVGFLSYDDGLKLEEIDAKSKDSSLPSNSFFGFYDCILIIDHKLNKLYVTSSGLPEEENDRQIKRAQQRNQYVIDKIKKAEKDSFFIKNSQRRKSLRDVKDFETVISSEGIDDELISNFTKEEYFKAVNKALNYIGKGDIYQVNLSQRFKLDLSHRDFDPIEAYHLLTSLSPSSFGGYLDCGEFQIISSSPERFLSLRGNIVETRPMKGTRPRGKDVYNDKKLIRELIVSKKEKAELLMITDLLRNDLGRVCKYGSVNIKKLRYIEQYKTVFQAISEIAGQLKDDKDAFDLLESCFPGGSITGCPKIRAMQIINELEPTGRSIYTGSLGYVDFSGNMDFNILIRTLLKYRNSFYFHVGGGIVYDSDPEKEYEETLVKAKALKGCLEYFNSIYNI